MVATHIGLPGQNAVQRVVRASEQDPGTVRIRSQWEVEKIVTK